MGWHFEGGRGRGLRWIYRAGSWREAHFGLVVTVVLMLGGALLTAGIVGYDVLRAPSQPTVCSALARARIATLLTVGEAEVHCSGVRNVRIEGEIAQLLTLPEPGALVEKLRALKATGISVQPGNHGNKGSLHARLAQYARVEGLRGVLFSPQFAVYAPAGNLEFSDKERTALVYVARALLRGAREPSLSSFPPSLRRVESVEVMVALAPPGGSRLLWRSTRGTSIPRALMAATRVARDRWHEREATMGGPLRDRLPTLEVQVSLLVDDGTLASAEPAFIDRAVKKQHGVGFDYRSDWHYLMPEDVQKRGTGSGYRALTTLAKDYAVSPETLAREDTRRYRFVVQPIGVSPPTATAAINLKK